MTDDSAILSIGIARYVQPKFYLFLFCSLFLGVQRLRLTTIQDDTQYDDVVMLN